MTRLCVRCALASCAVFAAGAAEGAFVQYDFTGTLNNIPTPLSGDFAVGDAFHVSYVVDTAAAPVSGSVTSGPGFAFYATSSWSATAGGFGASAPTGLINIVNDFSIDAYEAFHQGTAAASGTPIGFDFLGADVRFQDFSNAALADTQLVTDLNVLAGMNGFFVLTFFQTSTQTSFQAFGAISGMSATVVPAPGAGLALGLGALALRRRRR